MTNSNSNCNSNCNSNDIDIRPVSFAVVSTAEIARNKVIPALLSVPSTVLVAVSSRNKDRAQAFVNEHCGGGDGGDGDGDGDGDSKCKGMTHEEILSSNLHSHSLPAIDAVYVPLPSRVRNEFLVKALEHGKHIYSEKPHGGTVNELKAVLDLAASKNLQWMDGTMWYHSHRTKAMEQRLFGNGGNSSSSSSSSSSSLGRVRRVTASFTWGGGGLVDEAWKEGGNGRTDPSREPMGMLGDSGHYPVSAVAWAFGWELPTKVRVVHAKRNTVGAIIEIDAVLWFEDGGRAFIDTSCELPHRSQFEVVCDNGVLRVDDLVGGQGRTGNFGAYEGPFVGSSSFVVGDHLGRDTTVDVEPCDHVQCLVREFSARVRTIRDDGGRADQEWSKRSLCTHTILSAIFESAMRDGVDVELVSSSSSSNGNGNGNGNGNHITKTHYLIEGQRFEDIPTRDWNQTEEEA
eukprot:CAMPEP_0172387510 /NCGR_PEP_ID=MMETSP1061-20121228/4801_1 /TAXON_ID=37318 /ORGANISM="Pseudo-nitzschia pungens, Strain cf. pungens" /LENGTH=458 /DNA_ID=CAMNT_0013117161 /DNA_START=10 /DNA_END=1386 /DNA_ORIENTATION=+